MREAKLIQKLKGDGGSIGGISADISHSHQSEGAEVLLRHFICDLPPLKDF